MPQSGNIGKLVREAYASPRPRRRRRGRCRPSGGKPKFEADGPRRFKSLGRMARGVSLANMSACASPHVRASPTPIAAVDCLRTTLKGTACRRSSGGRSLIIASSRSVAVSAISLSGRLIVVRAGEIIEARSESSKPATESWLGISRPASRAALTTAARSEEHTSELQSP